jgi:hypothetical protein
VVGRLAGCGEDIVCVWGGEGRVLSCAGCVVNVAGSGCGHPAGGVDLVRALRPCPPHQREAAPCTCQSIIRPGRQQQSGMSEEGHLQPFHTQHMLLFAALHVARLHCKAV